MSKTIRYNEEKHKELESELTKIGENFEELISKLTKLQTNVRDNLEGNAATSLKEGLASLITKLTKEKDNWATILSNANKVERLIKEADKSLQKNN